MKILAHLLFEGPASPFYQALLLDGSLGTDYAAGTGYDTSTAHTQLAVGLQGLGTSALQTAEARINETFASIRAEPSRFFTPERVETALHQIQLGLRYSSANYGLSLVSSVTQAWVHEADPLEALLVDAKVQRFKEAWLAGGLFEGLLDRFVFGAEARRLVFLMKPNTDYAQRLQVQEAALIDELKAKAAPGLDLHAIEAQEALLKAKQDSEPDLSCLPCLRLDQVSPSIRDVSLKEVSPGSRWEHVTPEANGLVYLRALVPLPSERLTARQVALLPLLASSLTELGLTDMSAAAFDAEMKRFTGGLSFSPLLGKAEAPDTDAPLSFQMASFALLPNGPAMQRLLVSALSRANFADLERLRSILSAAASSASNSIASSGNQFAASKAAALLRLPRAIKAELLSGLEQARFLDSLSNGQRKDNDKGLGSLHALAEELRELRDLVLDSAGKELKMAVIASKDNVDTSPIESLRRGAGSHSQASTLQSSPLDDQAEPGERRLFLSTPFSSSFAAMALNPHSAHSNATPQERASLVLLARLLRTKFLHREIREKGGAYGASASYNSLSGLFVMSSYRDPEPKRSLDFFQDSCNRLFLRQQPQGPVVTEQDLLEAKLATLSALDAPVDLAARGLAAFQLGIKDEERQAYRDALLQTGLKEIQAKGEEMSELLKRNHVAACVIGSEQQTPNFTDYKQALLGE
jgi:Zn-dependent M16 (insulinase) family peptidase